MNKTYVIAGGFSVFAIILVLLVVPFWRGERAIILKFAHDMPEGTPQHDGAIKFKELVEATTQGVIKIEIYPNQSLGTDPEMVEMVQRGELAFTIPPTSKISSLAPNLTILDIPYLFSTKESLYQALDGAFGESLFQQLRETGIEPIVMWESGYKNFTAKKRITSPNHFTGLRFRIMPSETLMDQVISLNAFPANVDFHKIKEKLATNEIDCQENPISSIFAMKIYEEQTHLMESRHGYLGQLFVASKKVLDGLSEDHRKLIVASAKQAAVYQRSLVPFYEGRFLNKIKEAGVTVIPFDKQMKTAFVEKFAPIYYQNRDFLKPFASLLNPEALPYLKSHVAIGLNLSFSYPASDSSLAIKRGAELAIDEINEAGGILGRKLILLTKTHDGFPRNGINNLKKFSQDESVVAFLGGMHSPVVLAEQETVNRLKIPYLIPWAAATSMIKSENPYLFRFSVRDEDAGAKLVEKAATKGTKLALVLEDTEWGKSNKKSIEKALGEQGAVELGGVYWFDWGREDFSKIINEIYSSSDNVIVFVGNSPEGVHFSRAISQKDKKIPILSHWGITGGRFWQEAQDFLPKIDLSFLTTFNGTSVQYKRFLESYYKKYDLSQDDYIPAPFGSVHTYELIKILAESLKSGKSFKAQDLTKNLLHLEQHTGLFSEYKNIFSRPGREREALGAKDISFGKYNSQGSIISDDRN